MSIEEVRKLLFIHLRDFKHKLLELVACKTYKKHKYSMLTANKFVKAWNRFFSDSAKRETAKIQIKVDCVVIREGAQTD